MLNFIKLSNSDKEELKDYYLRYHENVIPQLTYSDFTEFELSGNRLGYEEKYFNRRRRLNSTFMMYIVFGEKYLNELCDLIWAVCDEFTWALPAHTAAVTDAYRNIDLFNSETAMCLTELSYILKDKLPSHIKDRISYEVNRRVISPYESGSFGWETVRHNWAAVCGGCIGMIYLYNGLSVPKRIFDTLDCYISGFSDGACLEGLNYWSYGFGYYMYFAELLKRFTGKDIAAGSKVLDIAKFQQNMYLENCSVSCSDSIPDAAPLMGLTGLLCEYFKGKVFSPPVNFIRNDDCGRWANYIRSYIYKPVTSNYNSDEVFYPSSQWYIKHTEKYSIFIKGGNNDEPHNHNDVGSFIVSNSSGQILCDIGCGEYTADYFNPDTRYNYLCNSSLGHNVPIIDGKGQTAGKQRRCTEFIKDNNSIRLEIDAYDNVHISRRFELLNDGIILYDTFKFDSNNVHRITERFVSKIKPEINHGKTYIGNMYINEIGKISSQTIHNHNGREETVYLIDFDVKENKFKGEFKL